MASKNLPSMKTIKSKVPILQRDRSCPGGGNGANLLCDSPFFHVSSHTSFWLQVFNFRLSFNFALTLQSLCLQFSIAFNWESNRVVVLWSLWLHVCRPLGRDVTNTECIHSGKGHCCRWDGSAQLLVAHSRACSEAGSLFRSRQNSATSLSKWFKLKSFLYEYTYKTCFIFHITLKI